MCIHGIVKGRVQGVWYRQSTVEKAQELKLTGWVKNLSNGNVELIACGNEESLLLLQQWLWCGPPLAEVTDVLIEQVSFQSFSNFSVKY